jgi:hypothetical protein
LNSVKQAGALAHFCKTRAAPNPVLVFGWD